MDFSPLDLSGLKLPTFIGAIIWMSAINQSMTGELRLRYGGAKFGA